MSGYTWRGNGKLEDINQAIMAAREGRAMPHNRAGRYREPTPAEIDAARERKRARQREYRRERRMEMAG